MCKYSQIFGQTQKIWTGTKHFATCKRTRQYLFDKKFLYISILSKSKCPADFLDLLLMLTDKITFHLSRTSFFTLTFISSVWYKVTYNGFKTVTTTQIVHFVMKNLQMNPVFVYPAIVSLLPIMFIV